MRMQLVLCKVQRCQQLMQQYLNDIGSSAQLLYTGSRELLVARGCASSRQRLPCCGAVNSYNDGILQWLLVAGLVMCLSSAGTRQVPFNTIAGVASAAAAACAQATPPWTPSLSPHNTSS